jgi:hypothetical protein
MEIRMAIEATINARVAEVTERIARRSIIST